MKNKFENTQNAESKVFKGGPCDIDAHFKAKMSECEKTIEEIRKEIERINKNKDSKDLGNNEIGEIKIDKLAKCILGKLLKENDATEIRHSLIKKYVEPINDEETKKIIENAIYNLMISLTTKKQLLHEKKNYKKC